MLEAQRTQGIESITQIITHGKKHFRGEMKYMSDYKNHYNCRELETPGRMFLNSSLARVTTHVLARVITHVLARTLLHVLAQSSGQFELACVATHLLARVATVQNTC